MSWVPNEGGSDPWFEWLQAATIVLLGLVWIGVVVLTTFVAYLFGQWIGVVVLWGSIAAFVLVTVEVRKRL